MAGSEADVSVVCSGAFKAAYLALVPGFEHASGCKVATGWGSSVAGTPTSIPARLSAGEPVDLVILASEGLDKLIAEGKVAVGSRVDLVRSGIGVAVRAGAAKPDLASTETLLRAIRQAKSIAHSTSASGIYLKSLFQRLGLKDELGDRIVQIQGEPVGNVVARGEVEIGFQQVSELLPVPGIDYVGPLPPEIQQFTVFAAGITAHARHADVAKALVAHFTAPAAATAIRLSGMEPV